MVLFWESPPVPLSIFTFINMLYKSKEIRESVMSKLSFNRDLKFWHNLSFQTNLQYIWHANLWHVF